MDDRKKGTVLVVDDEDGMRETLAAILELEDFHVQTAENGYRAIEKVKQHPFDIALLDIKMPGINGVETFLEIKKLSPETTVLMMTAYAAEQLIRQALAEGAYACLSKPFDMEKALQLIAKCRDRISVLLLNGRADAREAVRAGLAEKDYKVVCAAGAQDAIDSMRRKIPDVLLFDAAEDENAVAAALSGIREALGGRLPAVILATAAGPGTAAESLKSLGVSRYVKQPVTSECLDGLIRELVAERKSS